MGVGGCECGHADTKKDLAILVDLDGLAKIVVTWLEDNVVDLLELVVDSGSTVMLVGHVDAIEGDLVLILAVPAVALLVALVLRHNK